MEHMDAIREELREPALELRRLIPDVLRGYGEMSSAAMAPGSSPGPSRSSWRWRSP